MQTAQMFTLLECITGSTGWISDNNMEDGLNVLAALSKFLTLPFI